MEGCWRDRQGCEMMKWNGALSLSLIFKFPHSGIWQFSVSGGN